MCLVTSFSLVATNCHRLPNRIVLHDLSNSSKSMFRTHTNSFLFSPHPLPSLSLFLPLPFWDAFHHIRTHYESKTKIVRYFRVCLCALYSSKDCRFSAIKASAEININLCKLLSKVAFPISKSIEFHLRIKNQNEEEKNESR